MKITIITPTARENPRLDVLARTLARSLSNSAKREVELEWIIVDEKGRSPDQLGVRGAFIDCGRPTVVRVTPPAPSAHRIGTDRRPAYNSARNAGLLQATGDYVIFLNDCNVVTPDWVGVAHDCAIQGVGWKCKTHEVYDLSVPDDGIVHHRDHHDLLRPIPTLSAAGACWGAPMAKVSEAKGFDLAYDGERRGSDLELVIRLGRLGVSFVTTERAWTIQLRRTKVAAEITTNKEAHVGNNNRARITRLQGDRGRVLPEVPFVPFYAGAPLPVAAGAADSQAADAGEPAAGDAPPVDDPGPPLMRTTVRGHMPQERALKVLKRQTPDFEEQHEIVSISHGRAASGPITEVVFRSRAVAPSTVDHSHCDHDGERGIASCTVAHIVFDEGVHSREDDVPLLIKESAIVQPPSSGAQSAPQESGNEAAASTDAAGPGLTPPATDALAAPFLTEGEGELADEFDTGGSF